MVIGRAGYVAGGIIMNQLKPRMLNADGWNWGEYLRIFNFLRKLTHRCQEWLFLPRIRYRFLHLPLLLPPRDSKQDYRRD